MMILEKVGRHGRYSVIVFLPLILVIIFCFIKTGCSSSNGQQTGTGIEITKFPEDQTVIAGQKATFRVGAVGSGQIRYQWQKNGIDIRGATTAAYVTPIIITGDDHAEFSVCVASAETFSNAKANLHVYADNNVPIASEYMIDPALTDSEISPVFGDHVAYVNSAVSSKQKLFVFLPGTNAEPEMYRLLLQNAAHNGFHVIGLAYENGSAVDVLCHESMDPDCHDKVREEILAGKDTSALVSVDPAGSIENRLVQVLKYLSQQYSQDGWEQYLNADNRPRWSRIRLSGHSQGGGEAVYIAKSRLVDRVCFFASPGDVNFADNSVASWVRKPGVTPSEKLYGLTHERDAVISISTILQEWAALGLDAFGDPVNTDTTEVPYSKAHMLLTNQDKPLLRPGATDALAYHNITAVDVYTPLDPDGLPVYRSVWQYQCFL